MENTKKGYRLGMKRIVTVFIVCVLLLSHSALAANKTKVNVKKLAKQNWIEVSTPNFQITSNAKFEKVHDLAIELENFRYFVSQVMGLKQIQGVPPVKFLILKNNTTFGYLGFESVAGVFISTPEGFFSIANGNDFQLTRQKPTWGRHVIFHEMIHYFVDNQIDRQEYPLWYDEGNAEYLATMMHDKKKDTVTFGQFGDLKWRFYSMLRPSGIGYETVNVESLFKARNIIPDNVGSQRQKDKKASQFYARSFAVTHYLNSNKQRFSQLQKYITLLNSNYSVDDAFFKAFNMNFAQLTKEVDDYIHGRDVFGRVFKAGVGGINFPAVTPSVISLKKEDGVFDAMSIRLRFASDELIGDLNINKIVVDFKKYFPDYKKIALFLAKYDESRSLKERIELAKNYLNKKPKDIEGLISLGELYLKYSDFHRMTQNPIWTDYVDLARSEFRKAIGLDMFSGAAYDGLGESYAHTPYKEKTIEEAFVSYDVLTLIKSTSYFELKRAEYALASDRYDDAVHSYTNYINKTFEGNHTGFIGYIRDALKMREILKLEVKKITQDSIEYVDGSLYKGQIKNAVPHGEGELSRPSGDKYVGQWVNGFAEGKGLFTSSNGMTYKGDFKQGVAHGHGDLKYQNKEGLQRFVGQFYRFMEHGEGTSWYAKGYTLTGKINKGFSDGMQQVTLADGGSYELEYIWGLVKIKSGTERIYIGGGYDHINRTIKNGSSGFCKEQGDEDYYECKAKKAAR